MKSILQHRQLSGTRQLEVVKRISHSHPAALGPHATLCNSTVHWAAVREVACPLLNLQHSTSVTSTSLHRLSCRLALLCSTS